VAPNQKQRAWAGLELEKLWLSGGVAEQEFSSEELESLAVEARTQRQEAANEEQAARNRQEQLQRTPHSGRADEWGNAVPAQQRQAAQLAGEKAQTKLHLVVQLQEKAREKAEL
jgi:hypothetical protein